MQSDPIIDVLPPPSVPTAETRLRQDMSADGTTSLTGRKPSHFSLRSIFKAIDSAIDWVFGALTLIVGIALLSVIPVLNFLSLGYLLEASGRVGRSGKLRSAFVGVRKAGVLGRMVLGSWLLLWPVRVVSGLWHDAEIIAPGSANAGGWRLALIVLTLMTVAQIVWACLRGGRLRHFLWPAPLKLKAWLKRPDSLSSVQDNVLDYLASLRLINFFRLGALGFVGAGIWLFVPVCILIGGSFLPPGGGALLGLLGGGLLLIVTLYLPFLQAHFATEGRFSAMFEVRHVRQMFNRAPLAFWLAFLITLLFALPLYLLKIEYLPKQIGWLPSLLFVAFIFPARMLTGWAISRARKRETPRHGFWRWTARLGALPLAFAYVVIVYVAKYLSWHGALSLMEQHAFLVPAPMMSL